MKNLIAYIQRTNLLNKQEQAFIEGLFTTEKIPAKTRLLSKGQVERYICFLSQGIVKGFQNKDGKIVVDHLIPSGSFFTSFDSFRQQLPSHENFETVTDCTILKITKPAFDSWMGVGGKWGVFIQGEMNSHLNCKIERVQDFQTLTAKQRYEKLMNTYPELVLHVPVETLASFLGIEPPSLSRIRRQVTV